MRSELMIQTRKDKRKQKRGLRRSNGVFPRKDEQSKDEPVKNNHLRVSNMPTSTKHQTKNKLRRKRDGSVKMAEEKSKKTRRANDDRYHHLDAETATALRQDDAEIAALEMKLGLSDEREKKRLFKEYAKQEGYGDDFGYFLDDLDGMVERLGSNENCDDEEYLEPTAQEDEANSDSESDVLGTNESDSNKDSESDNEETVPMAPPASSGLDHIESDGSFSGDNVASEDDDSTRDSRFESCSKDTGQQEHHADDTYRPTKGEDIYGNTVDQTLKSVEVSKYVPPHMRIKTSESNENQESLAAIRRSLNNALNRLSVDTLITVAQSIARIYPSYPTANVNECIWENSNNACVARSYLMTGLIPLYAAAIVGVHVQKGDTAQLVDFVIEMTVTDLYREIAVERVKGNGSDDMEQNQLDERSANAKRVPNLMLLLCYLYNFDVVHCSLIYDVIRDLIKSFKEIDIELLLIILSHVGRSLRSDDPSALKAIVLDVQNKACESSQVVHSSSRVSYLVSAVMDLKNNKRRQQDVLFGDKTSQLRKIIGRIKSLVAANSGNVRSSDSSLRIRVNDILEAGGKGRWWRIGAAWEGHQHSSDAKNVNGEIPKKGKSSSLQTEEDQDKLLRLAASYRMNTDTRRSIFCIIMGSADFEDAFEKLVRAGMLKNKSERETARVLMESCGNEKTYNKFYAHLAKRICEFQSQSKFTFQLAYWDSFKQLEDMKPRKAANLAKLLFDLIVEHRVLKLNVLKGVDMTSLEDLSETGMIFLTVFFTKFMEHFDDPSDVTLFFEAGVNNQRRMEETSHENETDHADETEALYASLSLFFVQILKASPKYGKRTKFRANLKAAIKACDADNFFV